MNIDKGQINAAFLEILNDPYSSDFEKAASINKVAYGAIKTFVEQEGFSGKIIPPEPLTRDQCMIDGIDGHLWVIRPIDDENVKAVEITREGLPTHRLISGKDYTIHMTYRESEVVEKNLRTLKDTYNYDIQDILEKRIGLSLQRAADTILMKQVWAALGYNTKTGQLNANNGTGQIIDLRTFWGVGSGVSRGLSSEMFVRATQHFGMKFASTTDPEVPDLFKFVPNVTRPLIPFSVLMNIYDFQDLSEMPASEIGSILRAEFFQQYNLPHIKNVNIITTIHQDLCPRGRMYFFAKPDFIGHSFEIDPIQIFTKVDTFNNEFKMKGVTLAGQGIGNAYAFWELVFTPRGEANPAANTKVTCPVL